MNPQNTRARLLAMLLLLLSLLLGGLAPWDNGTADGSSEAVPTPTATPVG